MVQNVFWVFDWGEDRNQDLETSLQKLWRCCHFVYIQHSTVFVRETVKFQQVFLSHIAQGNNLED